MTGIAHATSGRESPAHRAALEEFRSAADTPDDEPGRWVGGAIGALVSLLAAFVADAAGSHNPLVLTIDWVAIGLLGAPIGFALGRQLLPTARSGGWGKTMLTGLGVGLAAPPLGALEILLGWSLVPSGQGVTAPGFGVVVLLPFAIPFSYAAVVLTVPVGLAWAVAVRLVPRGLLERAAAPRWLAEVGFWRAVLSTTAILVAVGFALSRQLATP